ncbi:disulfide bond formation protein B [Lysobacter sp. LF1]|uniref:Disulfide bond formation protein B n=1 Tax=Lysobacter stagni TaxID=3045172 RepID=A0ABT6XGH7_9GAMM|nr:disulfide bond formation protein B [Lysobacter sp. LF1]MDI9239043.1 disulfide bond formation protein B [Lysobacter sp. LF1]
MTTILTRASFRLQFFLGFLACAGLLAYAIYLQLHDGLEPCNLCIFQRVAFAALGLVFLLGALHGPKRPGGRRAYGAVALIASLAGISVAGRHVWVQMQPPGMTSCGAPLSFMRETMGTWDVVRKVMTATGNCGDVDWTFLGLSMPAWSLVWFVLLAIWAGYAAFRRR